MTTTSIDSNKAVKPFPFIHKFVSIIVVIYRWLLNEISILYDISAIT